MGSSIAGHILGGANFFAIGLWHLIGHMKLFSQDPSSYVAPAWFPARPVRHLELILLSTSGAVFFVLELFVGHSKFLPFDADGSIPSTRLHNHEHATIAIAIVVYGGFVVHLDRVRAQGRRTVSLLLLAAVFAQELLVFHFHSTDRAGVEGRFHVLLELVVAACLATGVLGAALPRSFTVSLARSACLMFFGLWLTVIGVTAVSWEPKGCELVRQAHDGDNVRCHGEASLRRAMAIVNLQFGWCLTLLTVFVVAVYMYLSNKYSAEAAYVRLPEAAGNKEEKQPEEGKCCAVVHGGKVHGFTSLKIEV